MSEPFLGEIKMFGGSFAPKNYAFAAGQPLPVAQNQALFSIFKMMYGGNGSTIFLLPNLIANAPMGWGQGPTYNYPGPGQVVGTAGVALVADNMAPHSHTLEGNFNLADLGKPAANTVVCKASSGSGIYTADTGTTAMATQALQPYPGQQNPFPHNNISPYLACNFIVALQGVFPQKP
ncbi:MAG TPA: tail fiber protein [Usitatibacter sp.]|nr:tail fiber protein [Usitatibacter sp.]